MAAPGILQAELPMLEIRWRVMTGNNKYAIAEPAVADAQGRFAEAYILTGDTVNGFVLTPVSER